MKTSESINELATALSKAQAAMTGAKKSSANPFFKSKYSDLASVCEAISAPFADNGLSYIQSPEFLDNKITVTTRIMHSSGQWIEGVVSLPPTKQDAQGYGSAITYGRRFGLQAMVGVPSVDDDGNDAVKHQAKSVSLPPQKYLDGTSASLDRCQTLDDLNKLWSTIDKESQQALRSKATEAKERILALAAAEDE